MMQRILTSAVGLVIFFAVLLANETVFAAAIAVIILIALYEMYKAMSTGKAIALIGFLSAGIIFAGVFLGDVKLTIIITMMMYMITSIFLHGERNFKDVYSAALVTYFITFFFSALSRLRADFGAEAVFLVFLFAWGTDTGAYFSGRFFGKHKLIPKVSPKKTVEGAVGGVVCTIIFTCIYLFILRNAFGISHIGGASYPGVSVLAVIASVMSQFGDLAASVIKRDSGVKDFGTILPGHGGIMDRFDSVVFIAPMVLYFFVYFNAWVI